MSEEHEVKSAWKLEFDSETGSFSRIRDTSRDTGVPTLPLETKLRTLFMGVAGVCEIIGDEFDANALAAKAEELAYGWAFLASENERVKIVLKFVVETSAWSEAIAPTVIVGGAIAWHHGLLPDQVGVPVARLSGAVPLSREQEIELRRRMEAQARAEAEAAEHAAASSESNGSNDVKATDESDTPTEGPSVVPLPSDADIGD